MLIRTQNRQSIKECNSFTLYVHYQGDYRTANLDEPMQRGVPIKSYDIGTDLGSYSTYDKAMKVLDMIEAELNKQELYRTSYDTQTLRKWVFNMPQDNEVN